MQNVLPMPSIVLELPHVKLEPCTTFSPEIKAGLLEWWDNHII